MAATAATAATAECPTVGPKGTVFTDQSHPLSVCTRDYWCAREITCVHWLHAVRSALVIHRACLLRCAWPAHCGCQQSADGSRHITWPWRAKALGFDQGPWLRACLRRNSAPAAKGLRASAPAACLLGVLCMVLPNAPLCASCCCILQCTRGVHPIEVVLAAHTHLCATCHMLQAAGMRTGLEWDPRVQ